MNTSTRSNNSIRRHVASRPGYSSNGFDCRSIAAQPLHRRHDPIRRRNRAAKRHRKMDPPRHKLLEQLAVKSKPRSRCFKKLENVSGQLIHRSCKFSSSSTLCRHSKSGSSNCRNAAR